jgi:hypothetical protein
MRKTLIITGTDTAKEILPVVNSPKRTQLKGHDDPYSPHAEWIKPQRRPLLLPREYKIKGAYLAYPDTSSLVAIEKVHDLTRLAMFPEGATVECEVNEENKTCIIL